MERLAQESELILLRIRSGQSFISACKGARIIESFPKKLNPWQDRWIELSIGIQRGHYSALESVQSFLTSLRFEIRAQKVKKKKALLPTVQAWSVAGTAILFYGITKLFFGEVASLPLSLELGVLVLMLSGVAWIFYLLKKYESQFWVIDWLRVQSLFLGQIKWGRTLHQCLRDFEVDKVSWPEDMKTWWKTSAAASMNYSDSEEPIFPEKKRLSFQAKYTQYWSLCLKQFNNNETFLPLMESHLKHESQAFEDYCETLAEVLGLKLMLPLFVCFCPAFLILSLGPMVHKLSEFN